MSIYSALRIGPLKVSVIGGGNWGTAISMIVAENAASSYIFDNEVFLWALEADVQESINTEHENKRYLPGIKLPVNLKCSTSLEECTSRADLLVIVLPHQFLIRTANAMRPHTKASAQAITLIKGLHIDEEQMMPVTFSTLIQDILGIETCCLSGANVAKDVALKQFSESTIGFNADYADVTPIWQQLFDTPDFKIRAIPDKDGVEVNGAIKNLVAIAAGFCDGMGLGTNAKSAIIRIGAQEVRLFCSVFFPSASTQSFFESCGFADLVTTCFGGRNVKCAAEFARRGGSENCSWKEIEAEMLGGQFLQGTLATKEVAEILQHYEIFNFFPLFKATYEIAFEGFPVKHLIDVFRTDGACAHSIVTGSEMDSSSIKQRLPTGMKPLLEKHGLRTKDDAGLKKSASGQLSN